VICLQQETADRVEGNLAAQPAKNLTGWGDLRLKEEKEAKTGMRQAQRTHRIPAITPASV
jgi:hypothetical protein